MSWDSGAATRLRIVSIALAALLAACTTTTTTTSAGQAPTAESAEGQVRTDAIDAAADASRRVEVRMELASAYYGRGQYNPALEEVKRVLAADPNVAAAYNLRGLIYSAQKEDQLAEESFRRALQISPRDADTMQNYGFFMCQRQRYGEADAMFRQALGVPSYRQQVRTLMTQGVCQARAGELQQAEGTLTRAYELEPANPSIAAHLAEVLYRRNELERARFYVRRINSHSEYANAQTLWLAARIEHRLGNRQGTQDFGNQLRTRFPQSREAAAFEQGRFDE